MRVGAAGLCVVAFVRAEEVPVHGSSQWKVLLGEGSEAMIALISCGALVGCAGGEHCSKKQKAYLVTTVCVGHNYPGISLLIGEACALHLPHTHATAVPLPLACITALLLCLASQVLLSAISSAVPETQVAGGLSQPSLSSAATVSSWIPPCSARTVAQVRDVVHCPLLQPDKSS